MASCSRGAIFFLSLSLSHSRRRRRRRCKAWKVDALGADILRYYFLLALLSITYFAWLRLLRQLRLPNLSDDYAALVLSSRNYERPYRDN
jgi:hypothetical protein